MVDEPSILRRNIKYKGLIAFVLICSAMFVTTSLVQLNKEEVKTIQFAPPINLSAGVSRQIFEDPELELEIQKLENDIVTATQNSYISIDEIEISRDMNLTKPLGISREDFCELLSNFKYDYEGFYEQNAGFIWDLSQIYQQNEIFMCGLYGLESYYGSSDKHQAAHNYGSIMTASGELVQYASDEEGIEANFKLFANHYFNPEGKYYKGVTLDAIGDTYCPPTPETPSWADKVYQCMLMFLPEENN